MWQWWREYYEHALMWYYKGWMDTYNFIDVFIKAFILEMVKEIVSLKESEKISPFWEHITWIKTSKTMSFILNTSYFHWFIRTFV